MVCMFISAETCNKAACEEEEVVEDVRNGIRDERHRESECVLFITQTKETHRLSVCWTLDHAAESPALLTYRALDPTAAAAPAANAMDKASELSW